MHGYEKNGVPPCETSDLGLAENVHRRKVYQPSDMNEVLKAIASWMKIYAYPTRDVFAVILTVHEAASNAFRHGNRGDCTKPVRISYLIKEDEAVIRVEDEGHGFDAEQAPDPYHPDIPGRPGGGLMLMRAYSHWIFFDPPGNRVTFSRRRSDP